MVSGMTDHSATDHVIDTHLHSGNLREMKTAIPTGEIDFAALLDYHSDARLIAWHWEPAGDQLVLADGQVRGSTSRYHWYLLWRNHPVVLIATPAGFDFGSSEEPATHAYLFDRQERRLYAGPMQLVREILHAHHAPLDTANVLTQVTAAEWQQIIKNALQSLRPATPIELLEMKQRISDDQAEEHRQYTALSAWLEAEWTRIRTQRPIRSAG